MKKTLYLILIISISFISVKAAQEEPNLIELSIKALESKSDANLTYIDQKLYIEKDQFEQNLLYLNELNETQNISVLLKYLQDQIDNAQEVITILHNHIYKLNSSFDNSVILQSNNLKFTETKIANIKQFKTANEFKKNSKNLFVNKTYKTTAISLILLEERTDYIIMSLSKVFTDLKSLPTDLPIFDLHKNVKKTYGNSQTTLYEYINILSKNDLVVPSCLFFLSSQLDTMIYRINGLFTMIKSLKNDSLKKRHLD